MTFDHPAADSPRWPLAGRAALVTGGAKRLGRAIALALAAQGVHIVLHYNTSLANAETTAREIRAQGVQAWTIRTPLDDAPATRSLFSEAVRLAGPVDILINNASIFPKDTLHDITPESLEACLRVNTLAPLELSKAFARQEHEGVIIHLLDTRIVDEDPNHAAYHLSKRMLFTLMRQMARAFAPRIRVNAVAPGLILPPPGRDESYLDRLSKTNPLQTIGSPAGVADAVLYLAQARFVTGQVLFVDGGRHMKGNFYGF